MLPDAAGARALLALALLGLVAAASLRARGTGAAAPFTPRLRRLPLDELRALGAAPPLAAYVFTSRLCHACHETAGIVAQAAPGLPLVELPVERHAALARRVGVDETPTLLLVDSAGDVRYASRGNPPPDELRTAAARAGHTPGQS